MNESRNTGQHMPDWAQLALCTALVERMRVNYQLFSESVEFGDARVYQNILNLAWEYVSGRNESIDFERQQEKLEEITPELGDFDVYGVRPAIDACAALNQLLDLCARYEGDAIDNVLMLSRATIESYLEVVGWEEESQEHPLVQLEQEFVQQLNAIVSRHPDDRRFVADSLKKYAVSQEQSNIGISLA